MKDITGVILAGGAGRRMEGKDKGLVMFHHQPLFMHVARRFAPQVSRLLISANRNHDIYQQYGYSTFSDSLSDFQGPLAGILSGLLVSSSDWVAFASCDAPFAPENFVEQLWKNKQDDRACWIQTRHRDHPVFCLINRQLIPELKSYLSSGERRVLTFLQQYGHPVISDTPESSFINMNTSEDLRDYEEQK